MLDLLLDRQADFVLKLLLEGLRVREALERGEALSFELEYGRIREMLVVAADLDGAMRVTIPVGMLPAGMVKPESVNAGAWTGEFMGIRYPLVCWLDEIFCLDSPWADRWNERKLEVDLYKSNDRAWKFWQQAAIIDAKSDIKKLEIYFWCVMLGFRGMMIDDPGRLFEWCATHREKLCQIRPLDFPEELEPDPITRATPHYALLLHRRMLKICGSVLVVAIPILFFLMIRYFFG